ncbi:MAG TPA: hypothetical protein VGA86_11630 [Desulfatiglandales bacterium]
MEPQGQGRACTPKCVTAKTLEDFMAAFKTSKKVKAGKRHKIDIPGALG